MRNFGFNTSDPIRKRSPERLIIGIMGGSLAGVFGSGVGSITMVDRLRRHPAYAHREMEIVSLGIGGYKAPQQLMLLNYLFSLGAEFDLIINIDGFNEVVLPPRDNVARGTHYSYPRDWYWRIQTPSAPERYRLLGEAALAARIRRGLARIASLPLLRHSASVGLIWSLLDHRAREHLRIIFARFEGAGAEERFHTTAAGPDNPSGDPMDLMPFYVDLWARSSILMNDLYRINETDYYHVLQPNQYLPGSKQLGSEERRIAFADTHPYRPFVEAGYPLMIQRGREIADQITFADMTWIFRDVADATYIDMCCHLNDEGNRLLGQAIADVIMTDQRARDRLMD